MAQERNRPQEQPSRSLGRRQFLRRSSCGLLPGHAVGADRRIWSIILKDNPVVVAVFVPFNRRVLKRVAIPEMAREENGRIQPLTLDELVHRDLTGEELGNRTRGHPNGLISHAASSQLAPPVLLVAANRPMGIGRRGFGRWQMRHHSFK